MSSSIYWKFFFINVLLSGISTYSVANDFLADDVVKADIAASEPDLDVKKKDLLPKLDADKKNLVVVNTREEMYAYLLKNPDKMEKILGDLIRQVDSEKLAELLPIYSKYPNHDPSVIDWGNAIIANDKGDYKQSISLYRKLNAALPKLKTLRFQMAVALYQDRQFAAAANQFEKLRSEKLPPKDIEIINDFLEMIKKEDDWSFDAFVNFLDDKNITNSSKVGTKLGDRWVNTSSHESGVGFGYGISADKKWLSDKKYFGALHVSSFGKSYFDNKKFNDISATIGTGFGYQDAKKEIEVGPDFTQRWYGGGTSGDGKLSKYSNTKGLKFNFSYWLNPNWRLNNFTKYSQTDYVKAFKNNDSTDFVYSNSLVYFQNQKRYFFGGADLATKKAVIQAESYDRQGVRIGWGQAWSYGMSTRADLGYARRQHDAKDFFGIKRKTDEYNAGLSIWNRGLHLGGLTPRLNWRYTNVKSNQPFDEYDKHNLSLELSKTF